MNREKENNNLFTVADIKRYHSGHMLPAEMHAIERAALNDPFLADALEGYTFTPSPEADAAALQQQLAARISEKEKTKVVPLYKAGKWLRAAAVIGVIAAGSWLILHTFQQKETNLAIKSLPAPQASDSFVAAPDYPIKENDAAAANPADSSINITALSPNEVAKVRVKINDQKEVTAAESKAAPSLPEPAILPPANTDEQKDAAVAPMPAPPIKNKELFYKRRANTEPALKSNSGAFFDTITSSPKAPDVTFTSPLKNKAEQSAGNTTPTGKGDTLRNINVVMKPAEPALAEVVVLDRNNIGKKTARPEPLIDTLEPEQGWSRFDDYIASNIKTPEELNIKQQKGVVELSFEVNKNGDPVNVKVTRSLCTKCDEEAIRLLKEGPKWKKKTKRGKVRIKF